MSYRVELTPLSEQHPNWEFVDEGVTVFEDDGVRETIAAYGRVRKLSTDSNTVQIIAGHLVPTRWFTQFELNGIARVVRKEYDVGIKLEWWGQ